MGSKPKRPASPPAEPPIRNPMQGQGSNSRDRGNQRKTRRQGLAGTLFAGQNTGQSPNEGQRRARPGRSLLQED